MNKKAEIGVIGGSGFYSLLDAGKMEEVRLDTPFGDPSDSYFVGNVEGKRVAFLARHGRGHRLSPSELNFRANIYGMKMLGVERIVSLSAVGSMKEEHAPLDFVIPDQFFDRTKCRISTFFGDGVVAQSALPIRYARNWHPSRMPRHMKPGSIANSAVRTFAWKARRSPRARNRMSIGVGAWT